MLGCVTMKKVEFHDIYNELRDQLQKHHDEIIDFGRELFACPELGFKEVKSNEILTSFFVKTIFRAKTIL